MTSRTTSFAYLSEHEPAQVLSFPADATRRIRRAHADETEIRGQILLFTGIRYERIPDMPDEVQKPQRKRS